MHGRCTATKPSHSQLVLDQSLAPPLCAAAFSAPAQP
eukprot:CAMPEP_0202810872 /NCGR_PEP_ID=MMETSP1389-20130828/2885_1 /ASSEMBLY_ACC=CAM_ASM_000865 /TAXON_ID=302021 /ORGANISM="Rhodomonas sp., Strain CCMP768" /LENGTH=36 /DNA_ID= /DNA_START= /DNA_END= /DNA_ORIENTATION=